jgi:hypothetical protein
MDKDDTKHPFENPQTATGGSYLRMSDGSLMKIEGHDVPDKERAERLAIRDQALIEAKAKHEAETAAAAKGGKTAEVTQAAPAPQGGTSPAPAPSSAAVFTEDPASRRKKPDDKGE